MNLQEYLSLEIHQADLAAPTHQTFCLLCRVQRDLLVLPPVDKIRTATGADEGKGGGGTATTNDMTTVAEDGREGGEER